MLHFNDRTYCASPNCKNKCGRKMTAEEKERLAKSNLWASTAYFCDVPDIGLPLEKQNNEDQSNA